MHLVNGRYAVVDLSTGDVSEDILPEGYAPSGPKALDHIDRILGERSDAIAICSGPLTASLIPAACAGFIRRLGEAPSADRMCPLTGNVGVELKFSGFDFIVLDNSAEAPGYLWVRDGIAEFVPSVDMLEQDSWGRTDAIRSEQGDRRIQVISTGPWADSRLPSSQLIMNYWGGEDKHGFAAEFGRRNLLAVAFRGMGELELEDPEGHLASSEELRKRHMSILGRARGLAAFSEAASGEGFSQLRHRDVACFGCPFPCRTFYKIAEDPGTLGLDDREPGYLAYDVPAIEKMTTLGMSPRDVISAMISCARRGAEPMSVADAIAARGSGTDSATVESVLDSREPVSSVSPTLGAFCRSFDDPESYVRCLALGLCPRYWARVGLGLESVSTAAERALGAPLQL
jgi:hypothetical protein